MAFSWGFIDHDRFIRTWRRGTGLYSFTLLRQQASLAAEVKAMVAAGKSGEGMWAFNDKLPVVFGTGSLLGFLDARAVERITVVYEPLLWNASERIFLIESKGTHYAYYPSDMESRIVADKAVSAPWGGKMVFISPAELQPGALDLFERLDPRFANARPQSEKASWRAGVSGVLSVALTLGVLAFLFVQIKAQYALAVIGVTDEFNLDQPARLGLQRQALVAHIPMGLKPGKHVFALLDICKRAVFPEFLAPLSAL